MRVLVTGGTGFLGANVVRHLLARGDEVACLVRSTSPSLCLDGLDVQRVQFDLGEADEVARALDGVEGVYHVAGTFDPSPGGEAKMHSIHVDATDALCAGALRAGVRRVVVCSSSITVGFGTRAAPGDEHTPLDPDAIYGRKGALRAYYDSKLASEELARSWSAKGVETVVVNPDYVVGAWDIKPTSGAMILAMAKRWVPVYPRGGKCFIDADDCALGHLYAMDRGVPGERYLLGFHNHSYREFMGLIGQVVGRRPPSAPMPRTATRALGLVGRIATRVSPHGMAGLDANVLKSMQQERYRSGQRAIDELGVPVTPLESAIEKAYRWFVDHGRV